MPSSAFAWGFAAHRYIMGRAIALLPAELKPFYDHYKDEIVIRATDPDLWRNVGWDDDANHFINFGVREYGEYPFTVLPREYGAAIEKFGTATIKRNGMVPWRVSEMFGSLRRTFETFKRGSPYGQSDLILFSGVAGHYIQDATQPLHATNNYNGQLTGQDGIHSRFERDLFERFESRLTINPAPPKPNAKPIDLAFDAAISGYTLVDPILKADREAVAGKDTYDDEYFEKFLAAVKPILEQRLAESITGTASIIVGAWEQAGKPTPALQGARTVEKVRKR